MTGYVLEWLNLLGRGVHVVAGIAWIGASFYFIWLDNHLTAPADAEAVNRGVGGELWAVHGGGMYQAQKYRVAPAALPAKLHWFKWEAYTTLLSGLVLLAVVYYAQPGAYLVESGVTPFAPGVAVGVSIAFLAGGWIVYDLLCRSPLGRSDRALGLVLAALCALAAVALCRIFPGRAAFLHFGAMLGTVMVMNVFAVIIPGQREMVAALSAGRVPDAAPGRRGKQRSVHNTYFTLPALFAMISNHYPFLYGGTHNAVILLTVSAALALMRVWFVARHKERPSPLLLATAALLLAAVAFALAPAATVGASAPSAQAALAIVHARCTPCHAARPTLGGFDAPPKGVALESPAQIREHSARIREQVTHRAMPLGNLTHMTDAEREALLAALSVEGER